MSVAIIFDCEFLTAEGAPSRFWCGPYDPDPVVAQIGAVKLGLSRDYPILETLDLVVQPKDRAGNPAPLDPLFIALTGLTEARVAAEGASLSDALQKLDAFSEGAAFWSWGKDEFNLLAISCFVEGVPPPIPANRFGNACHLALKAGAPYDDVKKTRSNTLSAYFGVEHPPLRAHDALDDARGVAYTLRDLLRKGALTAADLARP